MYGLLIENMLLYLRSTAPPSDVSKILVGARFDPTELSWDGMYAEAVLPRMAKKACAVLGLAEDDLYEAVGAYFVGVIESHGYGRVLRAVGRELREFLMNLDNIHDYLTATFPKMKSPSFFVDQESPKGLILYYRSKRRGFSSYVVGQIRAIAKKVYNIDITIRKIRKEISFDTVTSTYSVDFENAAFAAHEERLRTGRIESMPVKAHIMFDIFPFAILLDSELRITIVGAALRRILFRVLGKKFIEFFEVRRPLIDLSFDNILARSNNTFHVQTLPKVCAAASEIFYTFSHRKHTADPDCEDDDSVLRLKGSMQLVTEWKQILFLACPVITGTRNLAECGLQISDLALHDSSRAYVVARSQPEIETYLTESQLRVKENYARTGDERVELLRAENEERTVGALPVYMSNRLRSALANAPEKCDGTRQARELIRVHHSVNVLCCSIALSG